MERHLRRRPLVEPLESRALLSMPPGKVADPWRRMMEGASSLVSERLKSSAEVYQLSRLEPLQMKELIYHGTTPTSPTSQKIILKGTAWGTYTESKGINPAYQLTGKGDVTPLGAVSITGTFYLLTRNGELSISTRPTRRGTAATAGGSVSVKLEKPTSPTISFGTTLAFKYTIQGGTGAYRRASGTGEVYLTPKPNSSAATTPDQVNGTYELEFVPTVSRFPAVVGRFAVR